MIYVSAKIIQIQSPNPLKISWIQIQSQEKENERRTKCKMSSIWAYQGTEMFRMQGDWQRSLNASWNVYLSTLRLIYIGECNKNYETIPTIRYPSHPRSVLIWLLELNICSSVCVVWICQKVLFISDRAIDLQ